VYSCIGLGCLTYLTKITLSETFLQPVSEDVELRFSTEIVCLWRQWTLCVGGLILHRERTQDEPQIKYLAARRRYSAAALLERVRLAAGQQRWMAACVNVNGLLWLTERDHADYCQ